MSLGQNFFIWMERPLTRNVHVKYEIHTSNGSKVMSKVKGFFFGHRVTESQTEQSELSERHHSSPAATICKYQQ